MTLATSTAPSTSELDFGRIPPERAVAMFVAHAVGMGCSDLFFASQPDSVDVSVRHLGIMRRVATVAGEQGRRCVAHIKTAAKMDHAEKRRPGDGRWIFDLAGAGGSGAVDLRINAIPTLYGEDLAIRVLVRDQRTMSMESLGMTREQLDLYQNMIHSPGGLILITGPTGSGKTATLYASLQRLADGSRKINTIEDPVEFAIPNLRQSQINNSIELGFGELLRSILRQSPDVIMIGEVRDAETAQTAVHAANSGVLVFATLHAPAAAGAIQSMRGLGVHPHFLASSLRGVIGQRLVRTLCTSCRTTFDVGEAPHMFDDIRKWLGPDEGRVLYAPGSCARCGQTGYAGRIGVFEVMHISSEIRGMVAEGRPARDIRVLAIEQGMIEFRHAALLNVARGLTSTEEIFRVIPTEHLLMDD